MSKSKHHGLKTKNDLISHLMAEHDAHVAPGVSFADLKSIHGDIHDGLWDEAWGEKLLTEELMVEITGALATDMVNHPPHYGAHPSGIECITITEWFNFNVGNAIKYLWRSDHKNGLEDLRKAAWYVNREIERLTPPES